MISFDVFFENYSNIQWKELPKDDRFPTGTVYLNDNEDGISQVLKLGGNPEEPFQVYRGDMIDINRFIRITFGVQHDKILILSISAPRSQKTTKQEFRNVFRKLFGIFPDVQLIGGERISGKTIGNFYKIYKNRFN